jgi:hypothetical protein
MSSGARNPIFGRHNIDGLDIDSNSRPDRSTNQVNPQTIIHDSTVNQVRGDQYFTTINYYVESSSNTSRGSNSPTTPRSCQTLRRTPARLYLPTHRKVAPIDPRPMSLNPFPKTSLVLSNTRLAALPVPQWRQILGTKASARSSPCDVPALSQRPAIQVGYSIGGEPLSKRLEVKALAHNYQC